MSINSQTVDQFVNYLRFERHFSPYTGRGYEADLRQYLDYLAGQLAAAADQPADADAAGNNGAMDERLRGADAMVIRAFLSHLDTFGYSSATVARKIATLRSFYKWLHIHGGVITNPMLLIRTPKQAKRLPKAMTVEQVDKLLSMPDNRETLGARDRAILETLYSTGVRVSELVDLNRNDLEMQDKTLRIRG